MSDYGSWFIQLNQKKLRVDEYIHLRDAIVNDGNTDNLGQLVILTSTFTGSPRHMHKYTQDAMTYVKNYGRPDLFVTFTCNPTWEEIQEELLDGQNPSDRHDLLARVFRQKLIKLMNIITKSHVFRPARCWMYSIEWQKRGLPHAHILIWLKDKIKSDEIDSVISAELPDRQQDPRLFQIIVKNMIHGPCGSINPGSSCMKDGKCTKRYPRQLLHDTQTGEDGYPLYRRRSSEDGGFKAKIKVKIGNLIQAIEIDNEWVVPYCPLLSRIFQAHTNVEYCNSIESIKYICKYVNKGSDQAMFGFGKDGTSIDEVEQYQLGRYISSNEAVRRILDFSIHKRHPRVVHLTAHLENGQRVYFTEDNLHERIIELPKTTLTDDAQWDATMTEAATIQSPARLRNLFVILLLACGSSNPEKLWESYKESFTEDILIQARRENPGLVLNYTPDMFNQTLIILEDKALAMAG
ncbi:unnamed protein product, partial [Rotaria magnacalcarata]